MNVSAVSSTFLIGISLAKVSAVPITLSVFSIEEPFLSAEIPFLSIKTSFSSTEISVFFIEDSIPSFSEYTESIRPSALRV